MTTFYQWRFFTSAFLKPPSLPPPISHRGITLESAYPHRRTTLKCFGIRSPQLYSFNCIVDPNIWIKLPSCAANDSLLAGAYLNKDSTCFWSGTALFIPAPHWVECSPQIGLFKELYMMKVPLILTLIFTAQLSFAGFDLKTTLGGGNIQDHGGGISGAVQYYFVNPKAD